MYNPEEIIKHNYNIGVTHSITPIHSGIIHNTWKIETDESAYILQEVSAIFSPVVMEDIDAVLSFLGKEGFTVMRIVRTKKETLYLQEDHKKFWRCFTYIPGIVYTGVTKKTIAFAAGELLGKYHVHLQKLNYVFKHQRKLKHNIPILFEKYKKAIIENNNREISELTKTIDKLPSLSLPNKLRHCINHGDPKISNFIFNETNDRALTMIDFDDCGKQYNVLYELGSAFRSWCQQHSEEKTVFDLDLFRSALEGYLRSAQNYLTTEELELLPQALQVIPLELASRYVRDYFEDSYFQWDPNRFPTRKAHNIARAKSQVSLYRDIVSKKSRIREIIRTM